MKWVHLFVYTDAKTINEKLDYYSKEGWELVSVVLVNIQFGLFFKRPKRHI